MRCLVVTLGLLGSALILAGCGAGSGADAVRGEAPTVAKATGRATCADGVASPTPLVVDWQPEVRGDLEASMEKRIAVVAYDCNGIRFLEDCFLDGEYAYSGFSPKEDVLRLDDADQIRAELPFTGRALAASMKADLERGTTLDVAIAIAGRKKASVPAAARSDLRGTCAGATHFVRAATLGAFAVSSGSRANVRTAAEIFGASASASSRSAKVTERRDGTLEACRSGSRTAPKDGCGAVVRIELAAIGASASGAMSYVGADSTTAAMECVLGHPDDCPSKCAAGQRGTCFWYARMLNDGNGVTKDVARAQTMFERECNGGDGRACYALAAALITGAAGRRDLPRAASLLERGCSLGEDVACTFLGIQIVHTDYAKAASLLSRACEHGDAIGCSVLGGAAFDRGDRARAQPLLDRGCKLGHAAGCRRAEWLRAGGVGEMPVK